MGKKKPTEVGEPLRMAGGEGVSCSGHPEIACDVTPMAAAALLAVPPKSSMACVFNMRALKHALFKTASILFCKNRNP